MFTKERPDGTYIRDLPVYTQIVPYIVPSRTDTCVIYEQEFDVTKTLEFAQERQLTLAQVFIFAAIRAIALMPKVNRFVSGHRHYQRNRLSFTFAAKSDSNADKEPVDVTMSFSPRSTLKGFRNKIQAHVASLEKKPSPYKEKLLFIFNKLPRFLIKIIIWGLKILDYHNALPASLINIIPFYSTMILTDAGNMDFDAVIYRNYKVGTCGIFCTIGKIKKEDSGDKAKVMFVYDDRITDPLYFVSTIDILRDLIENPEKLDEPFEMTTEQFVRLGLAEKELNDV